MSGFDAAALLEALDSEDRLTCVAVVNDGPGPPCTDICSKSWQMCAGCRARVELSWLAASSPSALESADASL